MAEVERDVADNWIDPDDAPEWTTAEWASAEIAVGENVIRPGTCRNAGRPPHPVLVF